MTKKVLIISPYFPPTNAADMQRVRMSLPYMFKFNWEAEVVTVDERYSDMTQDSLLLQTIPTGIKIHKVKALDKSFTSKLGLGSIALRSLWYYRQKVNALLSNGKYDLIYFSTTQFSVCVLGAYWKKKYGIPYVIDMQDPWHSDYYQNKPKAQRPPKYWFSYRLNKYLEPMALKHADGLISVSPAYIDTLKSRYPQIKNIPAATIPFGAFAPDMDMADANKQQFTPLLGNDQINMVYVGRGGTDLHSALKPIFAALKKGLQNNKALFSKLKLHFIGTSYAPGNTGKAGIKPLAQQYGLDEQVTEITSRISYYHALVTLQQAQALMILGSDDPQYSASKIYPYLLTGKPVLSVGNSKGAAFNILSEFELPNHYSYDATPYIEERIIQYFETLINGILNSPAYPSDITDKYSALNMTKQQCSLFDSVLQYRQKSITNRGL